MKKDDVHFTMRRVTDRLREEKIPYAVLGGMAIALPVAASIRLDYLDGAATALGPSKMNNRSCALS